MKSAKHKTEKSVSNRVALCLTLMLACMAMLTSQAQTQNQFITIQRPSGNLGLKLKNTSSGSNSPHLLFDARSASNSVNSVFFARQEGNNLAWRRYDSDNPLTGGRLLMYMTYDGNIGVFKANPDERFHVNGNVKTDKQFVVRGSGNDTNRQSRFGSDGANHSIELRTGNTPYIDFKNNSGPTSEDYDARIILEQDNALAVRGAGFTVNTGNLPNGYKFAVNGRAIATGMKIQTVDNWPDYVFANDYNLRPLSEVEDFITANKHLPNVPSAAQVAKEEGFDVAMINKALLEKVEELTLYTIAQEKKIAAQEARLEALVAKVNAMTH